MKIQSIEFMHPVNLTGSGSDGFCSRGKHPATEVAEVAGGAWFEFTTRVGDRVHVIRVPMTNIAYIQYAYEPPAPKRAA